MAKVVEFLQIAIITLSITALIAGVALGVWGWVKSRRSDTGTKADNRAFSVTETLVPDAPLVLP